MLVALFLASHARGGGFRKLPLLLVILVPFQVWGVCAEWLLTVAVSVHLGEFSTPYADFNEVPVNLFGLAQQLGFLLLPTLAPAALWLYFERRFVATVVFERFMTATVEGDRNPNRP